MIETIEEDNDNSPLEYLIAGAVVLFFGGLYYYINFGNPTDVGHSALASSSQTTPLVSPTPAYLKTASASATSTDTPDQNSAQSDNSAEQEKPSTDDSTKSEESAEQATLAAKQAAEDAKLKADEVATLETKKSQLEDDVAKLEADRKKLLETNTSLAQQAAAAIAQAPAKPVTPATDDSTYMLPDGRKVDIPDNGFEGLLKQALNEKVVDTPIIFDGVYFDSGAAEPNQQSQDQILATTALIHTHQDINVLIKGHSDDTGDTKANTLLSLTRSNYMKNALVKLGIDARRIKVQGVGSLEPIAPNNTPEGRNSNRRIELILLD